MRWRTGQNRERCNSIIPHGASSEIPLLTIHNVTSQRVAGFKTEKMQLLCIHCLLNIDGEGSL